jgi:hypothetical protein
MASSHDTDNEIGIDGFTATLVEQDVYPWTVVSGIQLKRCSFYVKRLSVV